MDLIHTLGYDQLFEQLGPTFILIFRFFPYWGPIVLAILFWHEWMHYVQAKWQSNINWVILEIKVPKEINKTPLAMELALNALYQTSEGTWFDKYWKGRVRDFFSIEMVSIEGNIHFFIRTSTTYKNVIEAQLYAQYPDVEIFEVPDYTRYVDYRGNEGDWEMVGAEFKLNKPDPYPIRTYVDYGLDKEGVKEEFKTDPITSILEYLGSMGKGEQLWIQIIVRAAKNRYHKHDGKLGSWKDEGRDEIEKIMKRDQKTDEGFAKLFMTTKGEQEAIAAIDRSMGKVGFDCGIRALYLGKRDGSYNGTNPKALSGLLRVFTSDNLNSFGLDTQTYGYDYPWQDYKNVRLAYHRKVQFDAFKHRGWFYSPFTRKPFVLNTEELATIFHFPGSVAETPTFGRIPSRKSQAPVNLPI